MQVINDIQVPYVPSVIHKYLIQTKTTTLNCT
nr:MAG TPA: hypothetical protein [Caudoviricetes sp.]